MASLQSNQRKQKRKPKRKRKRKRKPKPKWKRMAAHQASTTSEGSSRALWIHSAVKRKKRAV